MSILLILLFIQLIRILDIKYIIILYLLLFLIYKLLKKKKIILFILLIIMNVICFIINKDINKLNDVKSSIPYYCISIKNDITHIGVMNLDYGYMYPSNNYLKDYYDDPLLLVNDLINNHVDMIISDSRVIELLNEKNVNYKINNIILVPKENKVKEIKFDQTINILISGKDTYDGIYNNSRSDVNIIATVNLEKGDVLLTSIPRDYYVMLHSYKSYDKLTHAGFYGIDETRMTLEDLLNIKIDYYITVNFVALVDAVDLVNGVDIYSDQELFNGIIKEGYNHLDGKHALMYARERKSYISGDRHRGQNQQQIIKSIINKCQNNKLLLLKYNRILNVLEKNIDTNISSNDIRKLIKYQTRTLKKYNIEEINLDGYDSYNYTYSIPSMYLYVMSPNYETINNAKKRIYLIK